MFGLKKEFLKIGLCFLVVKNIENLLLSQNICLKIITILYLKMNSDSFSIICGASKVELASHFNRETTQETNQFSKTTTLRAAGKTSKKYKENIC